MHPLEDLINMSKALKSIENKKYDLNREIEIRDKVSGFLFVLNRQVSDTEETQFCYNSIKEDAEYLLSATYKKNESQITKNNRFQDCIKQLRLSIDYTISLI